MMNINPMTMLLKYEGYPPAVLATALLHGILLFFLLGNPLFSRDFVDVDKPVYINASTVEANPQRLRLLQELETQRQAEAAAQRQREAEAAAREREAQAQREREQAAQQEAQRRAEQQRQQELAQQRQAEADRQAAEQRRQEELARQERERQQQQAQEQEAARQAQQQRQQQAAAQQAAEDARNVAQYTQIIHDAVAQEWSVPPSARNGMIVVLEVNLVPTGEIVGYDIIRSSGDAAFDRSALQAVASVRRFPELQDMPTMLFEANFRTIQLQFRPEDLLR